MGAWDSFRKSLNENFKVRIKPNTEAQDNISIARKGKDLVSILSDEIEHGNLLDIASINEFRTLSDVREQQYRVYDEMKEDSVISAALELYADDATQYNRDGSIIWVDSDSDNPDIAKFGNRIIDMLGLNANAWSHIYCLCLYGDIYLETFSDDSREESQSRKDSHGNVDLVKRPIGYKLEEYIEMYSNPCELYDITEKGKTVGFIKVNKDDITNDNIIGTNVYQLQNINKQSVYDPKKFIHISLYNNTDRYPERLILPGIDSKTGEQTQYEFKIRRGKSILHDVYKIYQELKLMEDSILLNRVTRSSIIRLLQVEVGDSTKSQITNIMKRLKQMIEQRTMLNKNEGTFKNQASPGPIDNIIYVPTRNGKGTVSMSNIGGDVDIKSIADIDYFSNKLYGGLKIPKQFLGQNMEGSGLSSGTSLTKLDARYARTIKRIQNAYIQGITTLINIFALDKGLDDYVNNFTVKMVSPSTIEDSERDDTMSNRMSLISDFIELLGDQYSDETTKKVFEYFVDTYLSDNELSEILKDDKKVPDENPSDSNGDSDEAGFGSAEGGGDFGDDLGMDDLEDSTEIDNSEFNAENDTGENIGFEDSETTEENNEEFGDFEGDY